MGPDRDVLKVYRATDKAREEGHPLGLVRIHSPEKDGTHRYPDGFGRMLPMTPELIAQWIAEGLLEEFPR